MRDVVILRDVVIDQSGTLWCGPCLVSAFAGAPLTVAEEALRKAGCGDFGATTPEDVAAAFWAFGFGMRGVYAFAPGREPPLWRFLRMLDARHHGEARLAISIGPLSDLHWVATCGVIMPLICDSMRRGRWVRFDEEGTDADAPVGAAWIVERRHGC
jgi:hypothetical protein